MRPIQHPDVTDEVYDHRENRDSVGQEQVVRFRVAPSGHHFNNSMQSQAMMISTQHLLLQQTTESALGLAEAAEAAATTNGTSATVKTMAVDSTPAPGTPAY
jgi:hypothetical protein